jgi:hypothetical protein
MYHKSGIKGNGQPQGEHRSVLKCRLFATREHFTASESAEMYLPPTWRFIASGCGIFKKPTLEKSQPPR